MNEEHEAQNGAVKLRRHPLWLDLLEEIIAEGVTEGQVFEAKWFEERLRCKRDTLEYGIGISEIRKGLEDRVGFYLSGHGFKGEKFAILEAKWNVLVATNYTIDASRNLRRGLTLCVHTNRDLLNKEEQRRLESVQEKIAIKLALINHSRSASKLIAKHSPGLLGNGKANGTTNQPKSTEE